MKTFAVTILVLTLSAFPARGQLNHPSDFAGDRTWAGWAFQEENDVLSRTNVDKYYTQGLRFSMTRNPANNPALVDKAADAFLRTFNPGFFGSAKNVWALGIGQNIYTPDDITRTAPQLNDRHWGGFLYISNVLQIVDVNETQRHVIELQTGIVGPASGARFAQAKIHELIDSAPPVGWPNQLRNEPGVNMIYQRDWRFILSKRPLDLDVQPFVGGSLGNVMTYGAAGAIARLGKNNTGFLNGALKATAASNFSGTRPPLEGWVYAGVQGRAVAHNIFLSGGFLRDVPSELETERFVYDLMTGFSVRYRRWRLTYNLVRRSAEFDHPLAIGDGKQQYGSVVLSVERIFQ